MHENLQLFFTISLERRYARCRTDCVRTEQYDDVARLSNLNESLR
jgi:hypothetical protein